MKKIKIILSGGGTIGSVSPLLAIADAIKANGINDSAIADFLWVGTKNGPEKEVVRDAGIRFVPVLSGKLRRYFDWRNIVDVIFIKLGFFQSIGIIYRERPDLIISAGGFVSVPLVWAAWFFHVPSIIHQQDVRPGLANKLMSPFARVITVSFEKSLADYGEKAVWTGNPCRIKPGEMSREEAKSFFVFKEDRPVILVVGGGTGAVGINNIINEALPQISLKYNIIHLAGKGKMIDFKSDNYKQYEFLVGREMEFALFAADLVISRAGMGLITELARLAKPTILIPMPDSHQEDNAAVLAEAGAAVVLAEKSSTHDVLIKSVNNIISNEQFRLDLCLKIKQITKSDSEKSFVRMINNILD